VLSEISLEGRVVAVTGAGSGIGLATAHRLASEGAVIAISDVDVERLKSAEVELERDGARVLAHRVDVSDQAVVAQWLTDVVATHGKLDGLAHCAGVMTTSRFVEISAEEWDVALGVNLMGTFFCVQKALQLMLPRHAGAIVTIASDAGKRGSGKRASSAYAASKAGVLSLTKSVAREHAGSGVRINSICPGPTRTNLLAGLDEQAIAEIAAALPIGRMGQPEDIAAMIVFLLSDAASFVYGASVNVDGGNLME
jgi:3-oxoacyl-[acyl-carrier protein] reductase